MMPTARAATVDDQQAVEALLTAEQLPVAGVAAMFAEDPGQFIVAVDANAVIAVAGVEMCLPFALLRSVAVRDGWKHRGLGRELVTRAIAQAKARGVSSLYLLTTTAEQYFPRFGFERVERAEVPAAVAGTVEFTSACPASAVTMRKQLQVSHV